MKRYSLFLLISLLAGCASTPLVPENSITPVLTHTGGQTLGDTTTLYWYTSQQNRPVKLAEQVQLGDDGHYQSDYRWREGKLREIKRIGEQLDGQQLEPFSLHVRYDTEGNAVFQRYMLGGELIPLSSEQLSQLVRDAERGIDVVKQQRKADVSLVQGTWRHGQFHRCGDDRLLAVNFTPALADSQQHQLLAAQMQGFMLVTGQVRRDALTANGLLLLTQTAQPCLTAPNLLGN